MLDGSAGSPCSTAHGVADDFVDNIHKVHVQVVTNLESSSSKYKATLDSRCRRVIFEAGDQVLAFLTKDSMPAHAYNKLKAKKIGPLTVLERINDNAYRLQLPEKITTSDLFNVRYLSRFVPPDPVPDSRLNPSNPEGLDAAS